MIRCAAAILTAMTLVAPVGAQPVNLTEKVAPGDRTRCAIELDVKGNLLVVGENGKQQPITLEARGRHVFAERVIAVTDGLPSTTARFYLEALASVVVALEKTDRTLPADRRVIVARRGPDGLACFAAGGMLSREELELVTEHFNPQCVPGLLPGKAVSVGDVWTVSDLTAQAACLFEGVIKTALTGKLTALKDGVATFTIAGTAEGTESGARVSLTITATGNYDVAAGRVTALVWKQKDEREQGPVNPASQVEATVTLKREALAQVPRELSDEAIASIPDGNLPARLTELRYTDSKGRYQFVYPREWHVTGQTDVHLVMRLVDRGEFVAQATVTVWRKAEPGKHTPIDEFKKAIADAPGWVPTKVLAEGELPAPGGRWLHRLVVEGKMDNQVVVQTFYLLAGPQGDQVAVTVVAKPDKLKTIGNRDLALVHAIEFGKK